MKYYGQPGQFIIDYDKMKHVFQFDENGEFETEDTTLIEWMRKNKGFIRREEPAVFETAAVGTDAEAWEAEEPAVFEEVKVPGFRCRKCEFVTDSRGQLLSHYKKEHAAKAEE